MSDSGLCAWINGQYVGSWSVVRGEHIFTYDQDWAQSAHGRALSLSMPLTSTLQVKGRSVEFYFENLLPDNDRIRAQARRHFGLSRTDAHTLLGAVGRDCAGAVQLLPQGEVPAGWNAINAFSLSDSEVADLLRAVSSGAQNLDQIDREFFSIVFGGRTRQNSACSY